MKYDIVVVCLDAPERCLEAVRAQSVPPDRIILINGPSVEGCEVFTAEPGSERNVGAQQATADVVVFVDSDVVLSPSAAASLCAVLSESDDVLVSGGVVDCAEKRSYLRALSGQTHVALRPRATGSLFKASGFVSLVPSPSSTVDAHFVSGAFMACRRKTVLDVPFVDELDFSNRVSRIGRVVQTPARAQRSPRVIDPYSLGYPGAYFRWHAREPGLVGSTWWVIAHLAPALRTDALPFLRGCFDSVRRLWREQTW